MNEAVFLTPDVPPGDCGGLKRWLKQQEPKYGKTDWFAVVQQAIDAGKWDLAWAHVGVLGYNAAYVVAKTPEEAAAALGQRPREMPANVDLTLQTARVVSTVGSPRTRTLLLGTILIVVTAIAVLFAVFVWPTAYRYDHLALVVGDGGGSNVYPVRTHRWTGAAEMFAPNGLALDGLRWTQVADQELPPDAVSALNTGVDVSVERGVLSGSIFNPTEWRLTKLRWDVTSQHGDALVTREYEDQVHIEPHSHHSTLLDLGPHAQNGSAELRSAWGVPAQTGALDGR